MVGLEIYTACKKICSLNLYNPVAKKYSRKDFLKLASVAGAGIFIAACGGTGSDEKKDSGSAVPDSVRAIDPDKRPDKTSVDLIRKGDPRYEELRKGFNKRINKFPLVIALCKSTEDVSEAIKYARKNNLAIAVKSGGHSMEGFSSNDGGMVINLSKMNSVEVVEDNIIKTGPGCTLSQLYDKILPAGRIVPAGSCGTVGIAGLTMGGGYGLFGRKYGLTCDNLMTAIMVDGNGNVVSTVDDPELLWALRGGGAGNFGVVTQLVYRSYPAPPKFQAHHFKARNLDATRAKNILEKWFTFAGQLPDTCFSGFVLNGKTLNVLVTNFERNNHEDLQVLMDEFQHYTDEFREGPVSDNLAKSLKNYYGSLVPVYFKNSSAGLYKSFSDIEPFISDVLDKIITNPGMIYQVNTLGGKIGDAEFEKVSCYPHRAYNYISELQAYWETPAREEKLRIVSKEALDIFKNNGITTQYINYCSLEFDDWEKAYYGDNYSRLQAVKKKYDPDNFIRHPQSIR
jgi:hypothetical protein